MKKTMSTLIVDDEPLARERIAGFLEAEEDLELIGMCGDGRSAVQAIRELKPELVFLDVQMPELDGIGVLMELGPDAWPELIFTTAYSEYAVQAFEFSAIDYLLKPFDQERFRAAVEKFRTKRAAPERDGSSARIESLIERLDEVTGGKTRLLVKSAGKILFVRFEEIDYIQAAGNYVRVHVGTKEHLRRETMSGIEGILDPGRFLRIHRSTIVNLDRVQELQPLFHGEYAVLLRDGTQLTMSRGYREKLQERLGSGF